jgi:hypothetical protein
MPMPESATVAANVTSSSSTVSSTNPFSVNFAAFEREAQQYLPYLPRVRHDGGCRLIDPYTELETPCPAEWEERPSPRHTSQR